MGDTLARAISLVHERGIIHRDLKPGNVLLTADGTPKLTDFGLAKRLEAEGSTTETGAILGTPSYMAPEQAGGATKTLGPAVDIYALGGILYRILTGRAPFTGENSWDTLQTGLDCGPGGAAPAAAPNSARPGDHLPEVPGKKARPPLYQRPGPG